jgi:hypothetical protein
MKPHPTLNSIFTLLLTGLLLVGSFLPIQAAPYFAVPGINVSPSSGLPGSSVTISGSGYEPGGYAGTIQWDGAGQSTFSIPAGGGFAIEFTIPAGATAGAHVIGVCAACGDGDVEQKAATGFTVLSLSKPTPTFTIPPVTIPSPTETPANVLQPPAVTLPPITIPTPDPASICTSFDLGPDSRVLDFDSMSPGTTLNRIGVQNFYRNGTVTISFNQSAIVDTAPMGAHSGSKAIRSVYDDFGSTGHPIVLTFDNFTYAVGLYVGREALGSYDHEPVFAVLTAYGYDATRALVPVDIQQVELPAQETPIQRCVVVHAPVGQGIRYVSLDYMTAEGAPAYDHRWVDDITYVPSVMSLPDAAPTVSIMYPADGSTVITNDVPILVQVHEDKGLSRLFYTLNGGPAQSLTFRASGGSDPTLYEARTTLAAANLRAHSTYSLAVTAYDNSTSSPGNQSGSASTTFLYNPGVAFRHDPRVLGDIWITGVEVTQAIQSPDNLIPLIGGKPTAVRVYVQSIQDGAGLWRGVMAKMTVNGHSYDPSLIDPRVGITASEFGSDRYSTFDSFVFLLNSADTAPGPRTVSVNIFTLDHRPESDPGNNAISRNIFFNLPLSVSIYGVTYQNTNPNLGPAPWSDFEPHRTYTNTVFPVTNFNINPLPGIPALHFDNSAASDAALIQARIWSDRMLASMDVPGTAIYLLQPESNRISGQAQSNGTLNGQDNHGISAGFIMAQEVSHFLGLVWHVPGFDAEYPNYQYPYSTDSIGPQVGFDTRSLQPVVNPGGTVYDIMSYGSPIDWVSPYTYCSLLTVISHGGTISCPRDAFNASAPAPILPEFSNINWSPQAAAFTAAAFPLRVLKAAQQSQYLFVAGSINPDDTAAFSPFEVITSARDISNVPTGTDYQLSLRDGAGNAIKNYDFTPLVTHQSPYQSMVFSVIVPFSQDVRQVILLKGNTRLAERTASPHAPVVSLLTPAGRENWSGMQTIAWQASDADNDTLTYTVEYSADGGQTWTPLNTNLTTTSLEVNFNNIPGSDNALVRVSASDGLNTTTAVSAGSFKVPAKGPQITIEPLTGGSTYLESVPFMVSAHAFDWQDGSLNAQESYTWSSDRDGALGTGPWIVLSSLTPGDHTLSVTVANSLGMKNSASVRVTISPLGAAPADTAFHLPLWAWILIAVVAILLLGLLVYFLLRPRK